MNSVKTRLRVYLSMPETMGRVSSNAFHEYWNTDANIIVMRPVVRYLFIYDTISLNE